MWPKAYRDYPKDSALKKERVEPGKGIIGVEMHEINGWGSSYTGEKKRERGLLFSLLSRLLGAGSEGEKL